MRVRLPSWALDVDVSWFGVFRWGPRPLRRAGVLPPSAHVVFGRDPAVWSAPREAGRGSIDRSTHRCGDASRRAIARSPGSRAPSHRIGALRSDPARCAGRDFFHFEWRGRGFESRQPDASGCSSVGRARLSPAAWFSGRIRSPRSRVSCEGWGFFWCNSVRFRGARVNSAGRRPHPPGSLIRPFLNPRSFTSPARKEAASW